MRRSTQRIINNASSPAGFVTIQIIMSHPDKFCFPYPDSDHLRICFKFEEESAEKDTEAMKKERFDAVMGMMQVTRFKLTTFYSLLNGAQAEVDFKQI